MFELNTVINGAVPEAMKVVPDGIVDLIVTSPPYNVDLGNNKYNKTPYSLYKDNKEHFEYIAWLKMVFEECYRVLKSGGRVVINIGDGKNGSVPTGSDITQFMKDLNYIPYTHIIWEKSQVGSRTSWGSFNSPSSPSFPTPFEHILVFCKDSKKLLETGKTDLKGDEFIEWSLALWRFAPEIRMKEFGHPAMFPEELPKRCIKMLSYIGAVVMDPFAGAGTTLVVAKALKRNYIGFEISSKYVDIINERLKDEPSFWDDWSDEQIDIIDEVEKKEISFWD